jgi:hypothetical protein
MSTHFSLVRSRRAIALVVPVALLAACSSGTEAGLEPLGFSTAALSTDGGADAGSMITISGTVTDPIDGPQAGITITLSGSAQGQVVTTFSGAFSFSVKPGGSYSLTAAGTNNFFTPPFQTCLVVTPSIVNLNNLTTSINIPFVGSGTDPVTNCSPSASTGATSGSLTLQGKVTSGGLPVAGARVFLNGSTQGYRTSDETGAYSFAVNPGSYSVNASGACASFTPSVQNLNNVKVNATANFQGTSCPPAPLTLCPTFDAEFGLSEPATCNTVSTAACAFDRLDSAGGWAGAIASDFFDVTETNDCRLGAWNIPPIVNDFINDTFGIGFFQQEVALNLFALQLFGCAETGNLDAPLALQVSFIPPDLIQAGLTFTTADVSAMEDDYVLAINQVLAGNGSPALTAAQTTAIRAQLDYAASKVPGIIASSKLTYSTCP